MTVDEHIELDLLRLRSRIAHLRLQVLLLQFKQSLKAGFDPNQPRVPAGDSDGGQWTDTGGSGGKPARESALTGRSPAKITQERERNLAIHRARAHDRQKIILEGRRGDFSIAPNPQAKRTAPSHEDPEKSKVKDYDPEIRRVASETEADPDLIRAVMYMETTHGHYGGFGPIADELGKSKSILPMNINVDFWGNTFGTRKELEVPLNNIRAGAKLLKEIVQRLPRGASIAEIATLYHDLGARRVSDYGARAERVYIYRLWQ
jgi:hypothetical protein